MKILLLTHSYPDIRNSWRGTFIREQARALSLKHIVTVVHFKVDYEHFAPFAPYNFFKTSTGIYTEYTFTVKKSFPVITQVNYLLKTYKFINKEIIPDLNPDIIHSHLSYPAGFLGTIIQRRKKIPNILTEHSRIKSYFRSWFHRKLIFFTVKNAACIISVSNSLKSEIVSLCPRPVHVIHNFADPEKFKILRSNHGTTVNLGFLGGLGNNNKGLDLLLQSVSLLQKSVYILHIGGNGVLLDHYKKLSRELNIEGICKFYGEISRDDIVNFYSGLDLFVLPSRYETFGIVLIEAMCCGLPVIATKCGGPQEIVTPETGILIEKNDVAELAEAIKNMSDNLNKYDNEAIRKYVGKKFGQSAFIENITALYKEVMNKN
jgi:glycosyltransferase involved in cell wall biosynthesis